jgi:hypothetical protein
MPGANPRMGAMKHDIQTLSKRLQWDRLPAWFGIAQPRPEWVWWGR